MKKLLLCFSILLLFSDASAQRMIPGYMGKRFTVGYTFNVAPNLASVIYFYDGIDFKYRGPLLKHGARISYVTGRREFSFNLRYLGKRIDNSAYRDSEVAALPDHERFNMLEYAFSWKRFGRTKFAPLGGYYKWEFFYTKGWVNYGAYQRDDNYNGTSNMTDHPGGKMKAEGGGFSYALGRQRIFYDKMVVDFGLSVSLLIFTHVDRDNIYEEYLANSGPRSMSEIPQFNAFIGLGFLAF